MLSKQYKFRKLFVGLITVSFLVVNQSTSAYATPGNHSQTPAGSPDTTFGDNGHVITDFGASDDIAEAIAIQPDGKIIVAGSSGGNNSPYGFALTRYQSNGFLDQSFGTQGKVFIEGGESASAILLQPDGKIIVSGSNLSSGFVLRRYTDTGTPDPTFGTNGVVTTTLGGTNFQDYDYAHSIVLQPDGKIIAAGASYVGDFSDFGLVRYNVDGSLDTAFDTDGKVTTDFGASEDGFSVALDLNSRIVVTGSRWDGSSYDIAVARYNSDGSLDNSFDEDGQLISNLGDSEYGSAVAIQNDGAIIVAGTTGTNTKPDFLVARYTNSGSLDLTFDGDGKAVTRFGTNTSDEIKSMTIQSNGRIVVMGNSRNGSNPDIALARYNTNGTLDMTFDGDGKLVTSIGSNADSGMGIALQSDSKIVVAGATFNNVNFDFAVLRYNTNGSLDTTFHNNGIVTTDFGQGDGFGYGSAVAIQTDGKILVAGSHTNGFPSRNFAVARYGSDGSLDNTFGTDGKVTTEFGINTNGLGYDNFANAIAVQPDGKIIAAGISMTYSSEPRLALARYNTNGILDPSFSNDGKLLLGSYLQAWAMALQPDGKIIVAGDTDYPSNTCCASFALLRFNSNGSLDNTFDGDGRVNTSFGTNSIASARSVKIQPNGKIVVAGYNYLGPYSDFALARYNANGSLDTTFDGDGKLTTNFGGSSSYARAYDVDLQTDGKIVVAGNHYIHIDVVGSFADFALARYNTNGSLDTTFDGDGKLVTDFGSNNEDVFGAEVLPEGKIVAAGHTDGHLALTRYLTNGSLDTTFDSDGKVIADVGGEPGGGIVIQPDGNIVVATSAWNNTNSDFLLARFLGEEIPMTYYVDEDANGANDGTSWEDAFTELQSALSIAASGDQIWVAAGTYKPTAVNNRTISFSLPAGVKIYGGFNGAETVLDQRDPTTNFTVLSGDIGIQDNNGDNSYHVVSVQDPSEPVILDGFTITGGNANGNLSYNLGGGIYHSGGMLTVSNSVLVFNTAVMFPAVGGAGEGGAIYSSLGTLTLSENSFANNTASRGGAIVCSAGNLDTSNSSFHANSAVSEFAGDGGAIFNTCNATIINSTFASNTAVHYGGAILSDNDTNQVRITNSTFYKNESLVGGGVINYGKLMVTNSTFAENNSPAGGAVMNGMGGILSLRNSILANSTGSVDCLRSDSTPATENINNLIETTGEGFESCGTSLLTTDPNLDILQGNGGSTETMALLQESPAINAGNNAVCAIIDQRGVTRPQGTYCDLGAYEYQDATPPTVVSMSRINSDPTNLANVYFRVIFDEDVTGVDPNDFSITKTGITSPSIASVTGSEDEYDVTVRTGSGNGTLRLDLIDNDSIKDKLNNPLGGTGNGSFTNGETYTIMRIVPGTPVLLSPANATLLNGLQPALDWKDSLPDVHHYRLQVSTNNTFTALVVNETIVPSSNFHITSNLLPGKLHYWRVKAFNAINVASGWSPVWSFKTPLAQTTAVSPANEAILQVDRPTFTWNAVSNANQYILQASTVQSFSSFLLNITTGSTEYSMANDLPQNQIIFWRVRAKNTVVLGNWSATQHFTSGNPPTIPVLVSPVNNSIQLSDLPLLKWRVVTVPTGTNFKHYELQIDDNANFSSPEVKETSMIDQFMPQFQLTAALVHNTKFYWRVRAMNSYGLNDHVSAWSTIWNFRTKVDAPSLVSPINNILVDTLKPTFDWEVPTGTGTITSYTVQISTNPTFSTLLVNATTNNSIYTLLTNLPAAKTIYWRVKANSVNGSSDWARGQFVTP